MCISVNMNELKEKTCIICGEKFFVRTGKTRKSNVKIRPRTSKTCSKKCSRIFNKIYYIGFCSGKKNKK